MADGWDAMEGSVSGNGCRPTMGAMMISEAAAIATVANATGNTTLGSIFTTRAEIVKEFWLSHMWNAESQFIGVYKEGAEFSGMGGCTEATLHNQSDSLCCCVPAGDNVGHYANFSVCNADPLPPSPGNTTQCALESRSSDPNQASKWPCNKAVSVRELLGLGPSYYFGIIPQSSTGATKYVNQFIGVHRESAREH